VLLAAPGVDAGQQPSDQRLTKRERESIFNSIEICSSLETDIRRMDAEIKKIAQLSAGRDQAVDYVIRIGLRHREAHARLAAVQALALVGNPRALPALSRKVEFDGNYTVRRYAVRAMAGFGDEVALRHLFEDRPGGYRELRRLLAKARKKHPERFRELGRTVTRALNRYESLIARMAPNIDPDVQRLAMRELQRLTGDVNRAHPREWARWWKQRDGVPPPLHSDVNSTADRTTMMTIIEVASLIDARETLGGLVAALRHGQTAVKMAAAAALSRLGRSAGEGPERQLVAEALRKATRDPSGWVRSAAAAGLAGCDPKGSVADFRRLLTDWNPKDRSAQHRAMLARVRRAAVKGLLAADSNQAEDQLATILLEPRGESLLNWEIVSLLGLKGSRRSLGALARFAARGTARETGHTRKAIAAVADRMKLADGSLLREVDEDRLRAEMLGSAPGPAVAAVHEAHRRGLTTGRGFLPGLSKARPEAQVMAMALLSEKKWVPAVAELAALAYRQRKDPAVVQVACRTAARICSPAARRQYSSEVPVARRLSDREIRELRRGAARSLRRLLLDDSVAPAPAASAATALSTVVPAGDLVLENAVLEALVESIGRESLRAVRPEIGAALRTISGEDYPDEPRFWERWWQARRERAQDR
jgi:HEAT repeat protein